MIKYMRHENLHTIEMELQMPQVILVQRGALGEDLTMIIRYPDCKPCERIN